MTRVTVYYHPDKRLKGGEELVLLSDHLAVVAEKDARIRELECDAETNGGYIKRLESELRKWQRPHDDENLEGIRIQSQQPSLAAKQVYINGLLHRVRGLEAVVAEKDTRIKELEESRDEWKRQWRLMEAGNKMAEDRIKELEEGSEYAKLTIDKYTERMNNQGERIKELEEKLRKLGEDHDQFLSDLTRMVIA